MELSEPAMIDIWGATWHSSGHGTKQYTHQYELAATARRYEQYEITYAAKVSCAADVPRRGRNVLSTGFRSAKSGDIPV